ncbi:MAG: hypothetical protein QM820_00810 [Minicystis sp.]
MHEGRRPGSFPGGEALAHLAAEEEHAARHRWDEDDEHGDHGPLVHVAAPDPHEAPARVGERHERQRERHEDDRERALDPLHGRRLRPSREREAGEQDHRQDHSAAGLPLRPITQPRAQEDGDEGSDHHDAPERAWASRWGWIGGGVAGHRGSE